MLCSFAELLRSAVLVVFMAFEVDDLLHTGFIEVQKISDVCAPFPFTDRRDNRRAVDEVEEHREAGLQLQTGYFAARLEHVQMRVVLELACAVEVLRLVAARAVHALRALIDAGRLLALQAPFDSDSHAERVLLRAEAARSWLAVEDGSHLGSNPNLAGLADGQRIVTHAMDGHEVTLVSALLGECGQHQRERSFAFLCRQQVEDGQGFGVGHKANISSSATAGHASCVTYMATQITIPNITKNTCSSLTPALPASLAAE